MYCNDSLLKDGSDKEYVFLNNLEMFANISYVFKDKIDYSRAHIIDAKCFVDVATLTNFYRYYGISKDTDIIFKDWWSLDDYWVVRDPNYDEKLLNYICRPKLVVERLKEQYAEILSKRTVGIHVRRKDFISIQDKSILNEKALSKFDNYFKSKKLYTEEDILKQIKSFYTTDPNSNILLFTDDPSWCIDKFSFYKNVYVINNKPYEDLILLSLCNSVVRNPGSFFSVVANLLSRSNKNVL